MRYIKKCPKCNSQLHYDEDRDAYCCQTCQICMPSFGHKKIDKNIEKEKENADN